MGNRGNLYGLLQQSIEELSPRLGCPTVEPKREFIQVVIQVVIRDGALMGSHEPTLGKKLITINGMDDEAIKKALG